MGLSHPEACALADDDYVFMAPVHAGDCWLKFQEKWDNNPDLTK